MTSPTLSWGRQLRLALAEGRGAGRRFAFFVVCLAIGVGAVMSIQGFSNRLQTAIQKESKSLLAADLEIRGSWAQSEEDLAFQQKALPPGTRFVFIKEMHAMAQSPATIAPDGPRPQSLLVELKAVPAREPLYPLYGTLATRPGGRLSDLLGHNGALVEPNFLVKTGLAVGGAFRLGRITARVSGVIEAEPDRISRAFSIGPRVMVSLDTLKAAGLIAPGSRVRHRTLIGLPPGTDLPAAAHMLREGLRDKAVTLRTYRDMESSLTQSIQRIGGYLSALGVIALLMGGIGVAMILRTFMAQKLDTIAVLRCLGATQRTIRSIYLMQALLLGLLGSFLGMAAGYGLQFFLPAHMEGLLRVSVTPVWDWQAAGQAFLLGMGVTVLFTLGPLFRGSRTPPLRLFRHLAGEGELESGSRFQRWAGRLAFGLGLAGIIMWQAASPRQGLVFLAVLAAATGLLLAVGALALQGMRRLPPPRRMTRRYGLANLHRPNSQASSIITALGLGVMLILTIRLVQMDMIAMLEENTQDRPPNYFFIDLQKDQTGRFRQVLRQTAPEAEYEITPLVRSRFTSIDDRKAEDWVFKDRGRESWFINREFVLTYREEVLPPGNEIVQGTWWTREEADQPQVSLEEDAAQRLGAHIGSILTMDIQGIPVSAPVTSIRRVNWRNMRTNFYMIFSPGALAGAPLTFVATVTVPRAKEQAVQSAVVQALPNVTALSTRDIVETVERVVNKLMTLVDFMSSFALAAGLFILAGAVASTKFRRLKEAAILKTLGAPRRTVAAILGYEYGALGLVAAGVGAGLSVLLAWAVMTFVVQSPWHFRPGPLGAAFVLGTALTLLTGVLSSLDVLRNKPILTLRKLDG